MTTWPADHPVPDAVGQPYGDLTTLNRDGRILRLVGDKMLKDIIGDYLSLLDSSAAVYEQNGDYAAGIFSSGWCRALDAASRAGCGTAGNSAALACGRWNCHESCWKTSRQSIETRQPADLECDGGIRIYAVPVVAHGEVLGSLNFGYGTPPSTPEKLAEISARYALPVAELRALAGVYEPRPEFVVEAAKARLQAAARLVGAIIERREAEAALEISERRFRDIFDQAPVSISVQDWTAVIAALEALRAQGVTDFAAHFARYPATVTTLLRKVRVVDVNDETVRMFGARDKADLLATLETVFATADTLPGFAGELAALASGATTYRAEVDLRTMRQGSVITVLLTMTFPEPGSGSGTVLVSLMDITARLEAETALHRLKDNLEVRVRERTDALQAALVDAERQHAQLDAIQAAQTRFLVSSPGHEVFDGLLDALLALTGSEYGFIDELFHSPDGRPYLSARAITDVSWSDETRRLFEQFRAGTLNFDNQHSLYGPVMTTGEQVIANDAPNDPRRAGIPPGHPPLDRFLGLPLRANGELVGVVGLANRPGGYSHDLIAFLQPMLTSCGHLMGAWKSERRRHEAETALAAANASLEASNRGLEGANRELEAFSYSVSHDLRAPLRAIDGFSGILVQDHADRLDDEGRRVLGVIRSETGRMGSLIDGLLTFSRLNRQAPSVAAVDMRALALSAWHDAAAEVAGSIHFEVRQLPPARGDAQMLRQVWINLLANAVKFTRDTAEPAIEVGGAAGPDEHSYYVRDNGAGFDMRHVDKLFGVFQRLHGEAEFSGSGIGLSIVKRIVARHGGRVWADGRVNQGATFHFTLPSTQESGS